MKRKILHFIPSLAGGGAERQLVLLTEGLTRAGWDVHVVCFMGGTHEKALRDICGSVECLNESRRTTWLLPFRAARSVRRVRPDVLQTWLPHMDVAVAPIAFLSDVPWIVSERASGAAYVSGWLNLLRRVVVRGADMIVANSSSGAEYWAQAAPRVARRVIRNGVALSASDEVPGSPSMQSSATGHPRILIAGRLAPQKNLFRLVEALAQLRESGSQFVADIYGEGPLRASIVQQISAHERRLNAGLSTSINGYTENLESEYKRASLFVSVSLFEGSPNTVIEAAARGCPLVISDIGEHRELFDTSSAVFVDPLSPKSIAEGIRLALGCPVQSAKRAEVAFQTVRKLSVERLVSNYTSLYSELLAHAKSKGKQ
jgi:glycosyltransferase involved in cell wall biosynthesis